MHNYAYQATNEQGELVSGEIVAESASGALKLLENRGLSIRSICEIDSQMQVAEPVKNASKFHERIEEALGRREALIPELEAVADEIPASSGQRELRQLIEMLRRGTTSTDLIEHPTAAVWLPILLGGIANESNTRRLSQSVAEAIRETESRRQRRLALAYPLVVFCLALLVFAAVCILLVPAFGHMYQEFGLRLPAPTLFILWCSEQLRFHTLRLIAVVVFSVAVIYALVRIWNRSALPTRLFGFLTAGNSSSVSAMASFTHSLAELVSLEASLPEALRIAGRNCQHRHFQEVAQSLADHIHRNAGPLSRFHMLHNLPPTVVHALQVSPDGGPSIPLLRELSALYAQRVSMRVDLSSSALAPLAMIAIGAVVAFIVIALFMPLIALISSLA